MVTVAVDEDAVGEAAVVVAITTTRETTTKAIKTTTMHRQIPSFKTCKTTDSVNKLRVEIIQDTATRMVCVSIQATFAPIQDRITVGTQQLVTRWGVPNESSGRNLL